MSDFHKVVALEGELDVAGRIQLRKKLDALAIEPRGIVDLSQVAYIDSSGVAELLLLFRRRREHGLESMRLVVEPGSTVNRILEVSGLATIFPTFPTLDQALQA